MLLLLRKKIANAVAGYDADAQDYFNRAEALGGSFDLSAINATYTESYVKTAISEMVAGLKTDGVWDDITEMYLLSGVTFDGITAKLKYDTVATLTNNNFVSGDLLAAGSGAGLQGDGSTKCFDTGMPQNRIAASDSHLSTYNTAFTTGIVYMGSETVNNNNRLALFSETSSGLTYGDSDSPKDVTVAVANALAYLIGTKSGDNELFRNGTSVGNSAISTTNRNPTAISIYLFAMNRAVTPFYYANFRSSLMTAGSGLTDTQAANLSTRVNTLMASLGANVY